MQSMEDRDSEFVEVCANPSCGIALKRYEIGGIIEGTFADFNKPALGSGKLAFCKECWESMRVELDRGLQHAIRRRKSMEVRLEENDKADTIIEATPQDWSSLEPHDIVVAIIDGHARQCEVIKNWETGSVLWDAVGKKRKVVEHSEIIEKV